MTPQKELRIWPYFVLAAIYLVVAAVINVTRGNVQVAALEELGLVLTLLGWGICRQIRSSATQNAERLSDLSFIL